jgi:hypothetical protein
MPAHSNPAVAIHTHRPATLYILAFKSAHAAVYKVTSLLLSQSDDFSIIFIK